MGIDCEKTIIDKIFSVSDLINFLKTKITKRQGDDIQIKEDKFCIRLKSTSIKLSKRYVKFLSKKYLATKKLNDYFRVIASTNDRYGCKFAVRMSSHARSR